MSRLLGYFLRGLAVVAPLAITGYVCWVIFRTIDSWIALPVPGAGFALTVAFVTAVGFLASSFVTRGALSLIDRVLARVPFVRILYNASKDLLDAFVGEKRRFDVPVAVRLLPGSEARMLGFVTQPALDGYGADGMIGVYLPQSYNFAGSLVLVARDAVERLDVESADLMAFIVSGGVTHPPAARRRPSVPLEAFDEGAPVRPTMPPTAPR